MEKHKQQKKEKSFRTKTAILFGILTFAFLNACSPAVANPTIAPPSPTPTLTPTGPIVDVSYMQGVEKTIFSLIPPFNMEYVTSPLKVESVGGIPISIEDPSYPCGNQNELIPTPEVIPSFFISYERVQLCSNIELLAKIFVDRILPKNEKENNAKKIIILSPKDTQLYCQEENAAGCFVPSADQILLANGSGLGPLAHEETHSLTLIGSSSYYSEETNSCFLTNPKGGFIMIYEEDDSSNIVYIHPELLPSLSEMYIIMFEQKAGENFTTNMPTYVMVSKSSEEKMNKVRDAFNSLDFSSETPNFILDETISLEQIAKYLLEITGSPQKLADLSDTFSYVITTSGISDYENSYTPIFPSPINAEEACK